MTALRAALESIPVAPPETTWRWVPDPPRSRTSPPWYLSWPTPVIDLVRGNPMNRIWFCMPATVEQATEFRPRRVYGAYCGAPPGHRCRCGAQLAGHDPGDEQP